MKYPKGVFITGTDTGVGKTVVSASLACNLIQQGKKVSVIKPIQTGTSSQQVLDIEFVYKVLEKDLVLEEKCYYRFPDSLSPKSASEFDRKQIDAKFIMQKIEIQSEINDIVIVEGAGGWLVPINSSYLMSDLAWDLGYPIIIVARPGLGTINHTYLTVESALKRGLKIIGIVLNNFPRNPNKSEKTNPSEIVRLTGIPIVGVIYEDKRIDVESGQIGFVKKNARSSFVPVFGGTLNIEGFLNRLNN